MDTDKVMINFEIGNTFEEITKNDLTVGNNQCKYKWNLFLKITDEKYYKMIEKLIK